MLLGSMASAQTPVPLNDSIAGMPIIYFPKGEMHDFGVVKEGPNADYEFEFINRGKSPLIIRSCQPSCGCISPSWPKEPLLPGKKGIIKISYCTMGRPGYFTKTIVVYSNGVSPEGKECVRLIIKGRVVASYIPPVPEKDSSLIKHND